MNEPVDRGVARVEISRNVELTHSWGGEMRSCSNAGRYRCEKKSRKPRLCRIYDLGNLQEKEKISPVKIWELVVWYVHTS